MIQLCFATNNRHKIEEISRLVGTNFHIVSLQEIGCYEELPETHDTIEENAFEKAEYVWEHFGVSCFADDSGIEVEALNGEPGVNTAFYAGPQRNANDNMDLLLKNLQGKANRNAHFRTCIALIINGEKHLFEGRIEGHILERQQGTGGFGYDPIFMPSGYQKSFAEMTLDEKGSISHRGKAVQKLIEFLQTMQK
ncbi:non-canonical purine NTP diphosphatase [Xanthocytophaga flava]|uniref:non-canonical purine NTP diphosphatase n=1 Tax=Xanthocytophaga flava TaxID=3048013 RepID=UPI0028D14B7A|nr:non-canonical purine NTP diphosphatase [Xanthocytophaga flavus]